MKSILRTRLAHGLHLPLADRVAPVVIIVVVAAEEVEEVALDALGLPAADSTVSARATSVGLRALQLGFRALIHAPLEVVDVTIGNRNHCRVT